MEEVGTLKKGSILWSALSDVGKVRKNNEDAFLALELVDHETHYLGKYGQSNLGNGDYLYAVSDGMGGAKSGEYASRIVVDKIMKLFPQSLLAGAIGFDRGVTEILSQLAHEAQIEMDALGKHYEECQGMGATLSLCWFSPKWMNFVHVGDSRIYHLRKGQAIQQITEDHSHVGHLLRTGKITAYEAKRHPKRHILNQVLGGGSSSINPQIGSVGYEQGDIFVLCTDGVSDSISDRRIEMLIQSPPPQLQDKNPAERIIHDALEESGRDNLTAVVVEV